MWHPVSDPPETGGSSLASNTYQLCVSFEEWLKPLWTRLPHQISCYWSKPGSPHPRAVKPVSWHWVVVKEGAACLARLGKEQRQLMLERQDGFQAEGGRSSPGMVFWLAGEVIKRQHPLSCCKPSKVCVLGVSMQLTSSTCWGLPTLQSNPRVRLGRSSTALEEELKALILSCFTLFLCFCVFSLFWVNLPFGTQGWPQRLRSFHGQEAEGTAGPSWGQNEEDT